MAESEDPLKWTSLPTNLEEKILDITGLIQVKANVLRSQKPVEWLPYLHAGLISRSDYNFITAFQETKTKEERDKLLEYFKEGSFTTLVSVAQRVCIVEEIQKFLVLIDDMLWEDMSRIHYFNPKETKPWQAFLDLLSCVDDFVRNIASRIICKFLSVRECEPADSELKLFFTWLKNELQSENKYLLSVCRCLQRLLNIDTHRTVFFQVNGIFRIVRLLSIGVKTQAQYQLAYCLWVSSFNWQIAENLNNFGTIPVLIKLLECSQSELIKLQRIILATFRNLLEKPREEGVRKHNALVMIQCKIFKFLETIRSREKTISDPEFLADIEVVEKILKQYVAELSTFDEYKLEVKSEHLEWSVVHTSKAFWKENSDRLNENSYELLKILVSLLETSKEPTILCVAAHDLGEYMSHYSRGKRVVQELGGKDALLELLSSKDPVVKYHALRSLQILMLSNSDLLGEYAPSDKMEGEGEN